MLRKALALAAGLALTLAGLVGLVIPVLPGLVFLAAAAACFSMASRRFRAALEGHLARHPRHRRAVERWRRGQRLPIGARLRLGFWLALGSLLPERRAGR